MLVCFYKIFKAKCIINFLLYFTLLLHGLPCVEETCHSFLNGQGTELETLISSSVKRKQNSAEKVKRKLTVWQYQYDNGEAGMLHERKGVWRGEKRIWSDIAYFPNENEAQKHVKDLCRRNGISEEKCMWDSRTYPDQRQDIGTSVAV